MSEYFIKGKERLNEEIKNIDHLLCQECNDFMFECHQCECGNEICSTCFCKHPGRCTICTMHGLKLHHNYKTEKELSKMNLKCVAYKIGCNFKGIIEKHGYHEEQCPYMSILYLIDREKNLKKELDEIRNDILELMKNNNINIYS